MGYSGIISFVYEGTEDIHKCVQYEVSVTVYIGRIVYKRKVPNYKTESHDIMCIHGGHMGIFIPNIKKFQLAVSPEMLPANQQSAFQ